MAELKKDQSYIKLKVNISENMQKLISNDFLRKDVYPIIKNNKNYYECQTTDESLKFICERFIQLIRQKDKEQVKTVYETNFALHAVLKNSKHNVRFHFTNVHFKEKEELHNDNEVSIMELANYLKYAEIDTSVKYFFIDYTGFTVPKTILDLKFSKVPTDNINEFKDTTYKFTTSLEARTDDHLFYLEKYKDIISCKDTEIAIGLKEKTLKELIKVNYLPTKEYPSDHINTAVTFVLKKIEMPNKEKL